MLDQSAIYDTDRIHFMKLIFKLFVILQQLFYIYNFKKVPLTNVHYFDNDVTVFIDSLMNGNYINFIVMFFLNIALLII